MEIRANYIIVGVFTLTVLLGAFFFTLWIAKDGKGIEFTRYSIEFNESVQGLSPNSNVLFAGIRVGSVANITISPTIPGAVKVLVTIDATTPVREDSLARLEMQGVTGMSVINIAGGTAQSPLIHVPEDRIGIIKSEPSPLASVMRQAPDTLAAINQLLQRADVMFSEKNVHSVTIMLESLATLSETLAQRAQSIDNILQNADKASADFAALAKEARTIAPSLRAASNSVAKFSKSLDSTVTAMEPGLQQFSKDGLSNMRMLMVEGRNLVHVITRVGQKLESDPRRFFFGEPVKEFENR